MAAASWTYPHRDLTEPHLPDGSPVLRPCVVIAAAGVPNTYLAVVDSGSPITVADAAFLTAVGIDVVSAEPVMEVPLGMGASFDRVPLFEVTLELVPPAGVDAPRQQWSSLVGARAGWRLPFAVLLGQRGWFDSFPTTIDQANTVVHLPTQP